MAESQFSLSWEPHKRNICNGLSALQQSGEFVDMTLAADGHLVKVHQVILALASPYMKELISTANCPHPVILLNKMSYKTLSSILEYVYTGEVVVSVEHLSELIKAAKELHIRGLEDMESVQTVSQTQTGSKKIYEEKSTKTQQASEEMEEEELEEEYCYFEIAPDSNYKRNFYQLSNSYNEDKEKRINKIEDQSLLEVTEENMTIIQEEDSNKVVSNVDVEMNNENDVLVEHVDSQPQYEVGMMQYTVSNQGSLQMILNRFVYYLKHTNRDGSRQWRCVDYLLQSRCPATVVTRDDVVTHRTSTHLHPFHDQKILKKVRSGAVFSAIKDAVLEGESKKICRSSSTSNSDKNKEIQS